MFRILTKRILTCLFLKKGLFSILVQNSPKVTKKVLVFRKVARSCSLTKKLLKILKVPKKLPSRIWKGLIPVIVAVPVILLFSWQEFVESLASRDIEEKQLLQMIAWVNGDVVYESTKSPNNFFGPKTHVEKVMDCFSSSTITDNFSHLNVAKCHWNIFKISTQSVTLTVRANANVNCYCIICIVQEFLARIKCWVEIVIL